MPPPHLPKLGLGLTVRFFGDEDDEFEEYDAEKLSKHLSRAHEEGARGPAPEAGSEQLTALTKAHAAATAEEEDEENEEGTKSQAEWVGCYGGLAAAFWLRSSLAASLAFERAGKRGHTQALRGCCAREEMSSPNPKSENEPSDHSAEMSSQSKERK